MDAKTKRTLPLPRSPELLEALETANVPTLLMAYVNLTHDEAMLERFAPHIKPSFSPQPTQIPEAESQVLRSAMLEALTTAGADRGEPSAALMQKMMSVGVGERVEDEFLPLLREQMGFVVPPPRRDVPGRPAPPADFKVLIIGAGLTGLAAGIKLREAGYDYVTIEKNADVGGTWFENTYPGVGVDTPSHFYSYSFELNPDWRSFYPKGRDMQDYFLRVADRYDLRRNIQFESRVTKCVYDDERAIWRVSVLRKDGREDVIEANAVINAHGPVNRWSWPDIPGFKDFKGPVMHTAGWDDKVQIDGKRIGVIGTAASAAQLVPAIAPRTAQTVVFQRTKHWVLFNPEISEGISSGTRWACANIPNFIEWLRFRVYWSHGDGLFNNVVKDPGWNEPLSVSALNEATRQYCLYYMQSKFPDRPDLIEKLTPDFPVFSKRIVLDNGWFDALRRDNVSLEADGIECVLPHGIRTKAGKEYDLDVLICATGFDVANMLGQLTVKGRNGRDLRAEWGTEDPRAYLGVTVPGYPNYFLTVGPNSAPNHAAGQNLISETQINYIIECLDLVVRERKRAIETTQKAFDDWNDKIEKRMQEMIWTHPRANSYYNNSKGRVFLSFPYRLVDYWTWTRAPVREHFDLL
ncbi:MAG: NAD(P)/FAD-dependent oxidoreductase [Hyphomonadaceae bacterium]|nr:NAD(P)/FAD-dependent oxidoreductase [Hyphomonadaceae bacterium]